MRGFALLALAALATGGCSSDCWQSDDIFVQFVPPNDIKQGVIKQIEISLTIGDGLDDAGVANSESAGTIVISMPTQLTSDGASITLRPKDAPRGDYKLTVKLSGADANGTTMAIGSGDTIVKANSCNRIHIDMSSIGGVVPGGGDDMTVGGGDMATIGGPTADLGTSPDMSSCTNALPDEDSDGRGDSCDVCFSDPEPSGVTDTDSDGLPDACDPDVNTPKNTRVYWETFNSDMMHWSETTGQGFSVSVNGGALEMKNTTPSQLYSGDGRDVLPVNVRVQTWYTTNGPFSGRTNQSSNVGLLLGNDANLNNSGTSGILCSVTNGVGQGGQPQLQIGQVMDGSGSVSDHSTLNQFQFPTGQMTRLRLTQRTDPRNGQTQYTCELALLNNDLTVTLGGTVSMTVSSVVTGQQFMSVLATNLNDTKFTSMVAETTLALSSN